ncbi:hypothetical protein [Phreatobacter stygius]|uniref:Uncharacterized protein n=1 Tax=Phreatobacter stygius TaxID=1940610 RepID=A0A4D7ATX2_9HYPH|nr:hypothetical protein [Phreatobacter stygius]QCI63001.1 hypothetical protein E8M01_01325 [Phreatobacter stygius]
MTTIGTGIAQGDDLLSMLATGRGARTPAAAAQSKASAVETINGAGGKPAPAVVVEMSGRAKALLAKSQADQIVADRLASQVAATREGKAANPARAPVTDDAARLFDAASARPATEASGATPWQAGAPYGDPTRSDAQFLEASGLNSSLKGLADLYEQKGFPAESMQALRRAVDSGTLKIQKAADVADLNFRSQHSFTPSAVGGGYDVWGTTSQNPTGATKDAIDQGRAIAMWTADRGDIYISW